LPITGRSGVWVGVWIGVPVDDSCFFFFTIGSRCFLLRLVGLGLGDECGFSGERCFFFMVRWNFFSLFSVG
jgi:hypothetical protein